MMSVVTTRYMVWTVGSALESKGTSVSPYHAKPARSADEVDIERQLFV